MHARMFARMYVCVYIYIYIDMHSHIQVYVHPDRKSMHNNGLSGSLFKVLVHKSTSLRTLWV